MRVDPEGASPATSTGNLTDLRPKKRDRRAEAARHRASATPEHRRAAADLAACGMDAEPWQVESLARAYVAQAHDQHDASDGYDDWLQRRRDPVPAAVLRNLASGGGANV